MTTQCPEHPRSPSRFFFNPADDDGRHLPHSKLPRGVVIMQALGVVAVTILGFGPVSALIIGLATGSLPV